MNEDNIEKAPNVPPFVRYVASTIPMVFDNSLSYYEALAALAKSLQDTVDVVNNNGTVTEEYIQLTKDMQEYMDHYFDNLDVQEEIDNKLDEMVENGTFQAILNDYVAPSLDAMNDQIDENYNILNNKINESVAILNNRIDGVASGAPIAVSSIASMTDHDRIYVLTSDGNWYFWNGNAWTSGGVYQASQSTDDVEGLSYNQINHNLKYLCKFEVGGLNTNTGATISSNKVLRSSEILCFNYDLFIPHTTNTWVNVFIYAQDGTFVKCYSHRAYSKKGTYIPKGTFFKLNLQYEVAPEGGAPVITDVEESFLFQDLFVTPYALYIDSQIRTLNTQGITIDPYNLKYRIPFSIGYLSSGVFVDTYDWYSRLCTLFITKAEGDIVIPHTTDYDIYLATYSSASDADYISGAWQNITSNDLVIPSGTFFMLTVAKHPHASATSEGILYDVYDNDLFKALKIYSSDNIDIENAIDELKSSISLTTIDSKYNASTISTSKITDYMNVIGDGKSDNFIFFTDPHTMGSNGTYTQEQNNTYLSPVQKYYYQSPADFIVCGGDWLNTGDTPAQAKEKLSVVHGTCNYLFDGQIHQLVGNHDINEYGASNERITSQTVANVLNNKHGKNYYKFQSANADYYVLDSDSDVSTMGTYRWEQIDWLAKELIAHDAAHNTLLLHLIYPLTPDNSSRTLMAENLGNLISAYNAHTSVTLNSITYNFSGCSGHIDYSLVGHCHMDFSGTMGGVPVIGTINLKAGGSSSFDLISVDYTNMKFHSIRVGSGSNREINL